MEAVNEFFSKNQDPRIVGYPMMENPLLTIAISLCYFYAVKILGPSLMENRKPFELRRTMLVYNLFQVIYSTWLFYQLAANGWLTGNYSWKCQPVDTSETLQSRKIARAMYWYYISKFTELLDTVFFIMRKKFNQVSFLHVLHHGVMPVGTWVAAKYSPGGQISFVALLNSFVHIVMYTYYLLSAFGPAIQKYLWWKKYITSLQIIQFVLIMIHASLPIFIECNYPKAISYWITTETTVFLFLFLNFYRNSYTKKAKASSD